MPQDQSRQVREMFGRIAGRYDLMNFLMTGGRDRAWRRFLVGAAGVVSGSRVLDAGAGTGAVAALAALEAVGGLVVASDFTPEMIALGARREKDLPWVRADALALPFAANSFDAVVSAYLVRNVTDREKALSEMARVVRPGGRVACLETSPPPPGVLAPFVRFHMKAVIPFLGRVVARDRDAYQYLPETTQAFLTPPALAELFTNAGLFRVRFKRFALGTQAVVWGEKAA